MVTKSGKYVITVVRDDMPKKGGKIQISYAAKDSKYQDQLNESAILDPEDVAEWFQYMGRVDPKRLRQLRVHPLILGEVMSEHNVQQLLYDELIARKGLTDRDIRLITKK